MNRPGFSRARRTLLMDCPPAPRLNQACLPQARRLIRAVVGALLFLLAQPAHQAPALISGAGRAGSRPTIIDALGDTLSAGPCPQRIVSLSPSVTEILFVLGVDSSRIVGVTRFCDYPPAARRRPVMGGIVDPSPEVILAQRPDLVLAVRGNPRPLLRQLGRLGLPVFAFDDRTGLTGVGEMMEAVTAVSCPDDPARADSVVAWFRAAVAAYESWAAAIPPAERPTVYYADPEFPTWTAGAGSHIDDLVRMAGGVNLAAAALKAGPVADRVQAIWNAIKEKNQFNSDQIYHGLILKNSTDKAKIESLRAEVAKKDAEIQKLRVIAPHAVEILPAK